MDEPWSLPAEVMCRVQREKTWYSGQRGGILSPCQGQNGNPGFKANLLFFSPSYRPLGGLFYRFTFSIFGFNPLPFRMLCFAILIANLYLLYLFLRRLTDSYEIAALAALIACYQARFVDLYYSTGTIYDLLCFFFLFLAFYYYSRVRLDGCYLSLRQLARLLFDVHLRPEFQGDGGHVAFSRTDLRGPL